MNPKDPVMEAVSGVMDHITQAGLLLSSAILVHASPNEVTRVRSQDLLMRLLEIQEEILLFMEIQKNL